MFPTHPGKEHTHLFPLKGGKGLFLSEVIVGAEVPRHMPFFPLPVDHRLITLHRANPAYDRKGRDATLPVRLGQLVKVALRYREEQLIILTAGHGHSLAAPLGTHRALCLQLLGDGQLIQLYCGIDMRQRQDLGEGRRQVRRRYPS